MKQKNSCMPSILNTLKLAQMVKSKRGSMGLREVAKEIGNISAPTLSRIEQGKLPDIDTFFRVCEWLEVPTDFFSTPSKSKKPDTRMELIAKLREDESLDPSVSGSLINMINLAYDSTK